MKGCVYRTAENKCELWSDNGKGIVSYCDFDDCKEKKPSNADRIRAMSDDELAGFIDDFWSAAWCPDDPPIDANTKECLMHDGNCQLCILDWLQREANP